MTAESRVAELNRDLITKPRTYMDNRAVVKRLMDRILAAEGLDPVLHLLADDLSFKVAVPGSMPICFGESGKQGIVDYFEALGGIVTFWQVDYLAQSEHVIAVGRERFTMEDCRLTADSEFALVFEVHYGRITRLLVVEDLTAFIKDGSPLLDAGPLGDAFVSGEEVLASA